MVWCSIYGQGSGSRNLGGLLVHSNIGPENRAMERTGKGSPRSSECSQLDGFRVTLAIEGGCDGFRERRIAQCVVVLFFVFGLDGEDWWEGLLSFYWESK